MAETSTQFIDLRAYPVRPQRAWVRVLLGMAVTAAVATSIVVAAVVPSRADEDDCSQIEASKKASCESFTPLSEGECATANWPGTLHDLFSPDDKCPHSLRYIDARDSQLEVSANGTGAGCSSSWGRRFHPASSVNPTIEELPRFRACHRGVSFLTKVSPDDPLYPLAAAGALNFTLTLGRACGRKVLRWNGVYNGKGGEFPPGQQAPPSACDNFWLYE